MVVTRRQSEDESEASDSEYDTSSESSESSDESSDDSATDSEQPKNTSEDDSITNNKPNNSSEQQLQAQVLPHLVQNSFVSVHRVLNTSIFGPDRKL